MSSAQSTSSTRLAALLWCVLAASVTSGQSAATIRPRGVVVEGDGKDSPVVNGGIKPDDVPRSWVRTQNPPADPPEARDEMRSAFYSKFGEGEVEQAPRASATLSGARVSAQDKPLENSAPAPSAAVQQLLEQAA